MKVVAAAMAAALALPATQALAQSARTASGGDSLRLPYQKEFWGYAGASLGMARLDVACPPGTGCDDSDQALRVFGGGSFNGTFGGEVGLLKLGDFSRAGGEVDSKGFDLAATAGIPFARNGRIFGKLGAVYTRTTVTAGPGTGVQTGKANGWGPRFGLGLQLGISDNWAIRLDADRYRFKLPAGRENIDTYTVGAVYTFR